MSSVWYYDSKNDHGCCRYLSHKNGTGPIDCDWTCKHRHHLTCYRGHKWITLATTFLNDHSYNIACISLQFCEDVELYVPCNVLKIERAWSSSLWATKVKSFAPSIFWRKCNFWPPTLWIEGQKQWKQFLCNTLYVQGIEICGVTSGSKYLLFVTVWDSNGDVSRHAMLVWLDCGLPWTYHVQCWYRWHKVVPSSRLLTVDLCSFCNFYRSNMSWMPKLWSVCCRL